MLVLKDVLEPLLRPIYSGGGKSSNQTQKQVNIYVACFNYIYNFQA